MNKNEITEVSIMEENDILRAQLTECRKALEAAKFVLDGCGVYIRKNEKVRLKYSFADASEMVDNALIHSV